MEISAPALLRLTARPRYWRIAVILPGRILWRTYSRVEYPTPDDAVLRCLAGLSLPGGIQRQTDQRPKECRHGHAEPQRRQFLGGPQNKISEDSQSEGGNVEDVNAIHPRPLPPVRVRAAWWGWL